MVTRCITIIIITCYGTSPQVTIVTSSSHVWSTNTWALAPKSPIYCPRSILSFSDNSFKYPYTIKLTNAFRCFILIFLRQMDGSRFSDPIKIKPRATESLSLPVGNCGEGSIRSKTSSGYYILVIVFQQYPLHLIDVFCCLFLKYLSLLLIHCTWFSPLLVMLYEFHMCLHETDSFQDPSFEISVCGQRSDVTTFCYYNI